jgi:uncharacterized protein YjbJ (UPF0337 family)
MPDEQEVQGTVDKGAGKAKEAWGNATGDTQTKREGQMQQVEGDARKAAGSTRRHAQDMADDAKDAMRDAKRDMDRP